MEERKRRVSENWSRVEIMEEDWSTGGMESFIGETNKWSTGGMAEQRSFRRSRWTGEAEDSRKKGG